MTMKKNVFNGAFVATAILFLLVLVFSLKALWLGDEITYNYNFKDGSQISSLSDVVTS